MNNASSAVVIAPPNDITMASYWVYVFVYGFAIILNAPVLAVISCDKSLWKRTEMQTIAQLTAFEILNGVGFFVHGMHCLVVLQHPQLTAMTPLNCLMLLYIPIMYFTTAGLNTTLLLISIDRAICIYSYSHYLGLGSVYHKSMRVVPVALGVSYAVAICVSAVQMPQMPSIHPASCTGVLLQGPVLGTVTKFALLALCALSVIVYGMALVVIGIRKTTSEFSDIQKVQRQRQNAVNMFLAIVSAITALTLLLPRVAGLIISAADYSASATTASMVTMLTNFHSLLYALVFWLRRTGLRDDIIASIRQKLPKKSAVKPWVEQSVAANGIAVAAAEDTSRSLAIVQN